jgi:uncharacterized protein YfaS (alpha-2-macroglobulin family)
MIDRWEKARLGSRRAARLAAAAFALVLTFAGTGCGSEPEEGGAETGFALENVALDVPVGEAAFTPALEGPLRVISATPYGPMGALSPDVVVSVTFSRPMVPLGEAPPVEPGALTLDPPVAGALRWVGTQTLVFAPDAPLPHATAFRAAVASGLAALDGEALAEPFSWTFETPRLRLEASEPAGGARFVAPGAVVRLRFNQPVDTTRARPFIRLFLRTSARPEVPTTLSAEEDGTVLVLLPEAPLPGGRSFEVEIRAGLPAREGPLGMDRDARVRFETYGPLTLVEVSRPGNWWEKQPEAFDPSRGITLTFSNPVRFGDLRRALSFVPEAAWPPGVEARDETVSERHTIPVLLRPETRYTVVVTNLTDVFGQTLEEAKKTFRTRAFEPKIRMPSGLLVVEAEEEHALPVHVTNVEGAWVGMRRLAPEEIVPHLRVYDDVHYYEDTPHASPPPVVPANRRFAFPVEKNTPAVLPLHLDSLLTGGVGVVAVHVRAERRAPWRSDRVFRALAQVTRLGVTAKFSPHQNLVFVSELATAAPVPGARVTIRDAENRIRWEGETDAEGRVTTPGWARLGLEKPTPYESPDQYVIVQKDGDTAFTASMFNDGLEPYRFDVAYDWRPEARTDAGSVFSDRGLYRAGETVHVKGILRTRTDADWTPVTDSVRVFVASPTDEVVLDRRFLPSDLGTFDFSWTAPSDAALGVYSVRVAYASDTTAATRGYYERGDIARGSFRVDAFRTAGFAVEARALAPAYTAGDFFEGVVSGRYLFGAAMGGQPVHFTLERRPGAHTPPGFESYRFGVIRYERGLYATLAQGDSLLDANGELRVRAPLPGNEHGAPATLVFEATVTDPARQELSARQELTLHPGLFYIGLKPHTTFLDLSRNREMRLDVATVDPAGRPVAAEGLVVEVVRRQWNSVREVGVDGRLRWRSAYTEEPVGSRCLSTEAGKAKRLRIPITRGGSYLIRATGSDVRGNTIRSEAYFYATGEGYVSWERSDDDRIDLIPERTTYRPGETARFMVASPYERATALITVERDGILSSRVETLVGSAPQIEVPLTEAHLPNVFVSVILLNGRTAPPTPASDAGAPGFKIGYAGIAVDPGVRHLHVEIEPDRETYRPGEEATVALRLTDASGRGVPGEIAFAAADAGVLNLIGYALPDPFRAFYGPRALKVLTSESRAHLVRQRSFGQKEEDAGGGGGDAGYLLRQDFRPLAHWAPALRTDARGRATVTFRFPERLTTFRLMAAALTADNRFGATKTDVIVTQPLVLQPALPRFARLNDAFEAGVLVSNRTDAPGTATVTASAEGLTLTGDAAKTVALAKGETKEVRFAWRVNAVGPAKLTFTAEMGSERDALAWTLPVSLPTTKHTSATFAATGGAVHEALRLPADRLPGLGRFEARLSSTALAGLDGAARFLFRYPYGCLEQRTSRVRPLILADDLLDAFDLDALDGDRKAVIERWLGRLDDFWTGDGFSLWPGGRRPSPYVSAYVVLALAEAEAAGFDVPDALAAEAVDALARRVRNRSARPAYYSEPVWNDARAFMLYALARNGRILEDEVYTLAEALLADPRSGVEGPSHLLRIVVRANSRVLSPLRPRLLDRLRSRIRIGPETAYFTVPDRPEWRWIFASNTRATAFGLTALVEADPSDDTRQPAQKMIRYLMDAREDGHWASTQENAAVVDAFATYFASFEDVEPDFEAEVRVAGRTVLTETFRGRSLRVAAATLPLDALPSGGAAAVDVTKTGRGLLYYSLLLETYSAAPRNAVDAGLRLTRTLRRLDRSGAPAGSEMTTGGGTVTLQAGDLVRVTLRLTSPADRNYVVVDDALPAGLEALNTAFETTSGAATENTGSDRWWGSFNHTEIHDDRVLLFADYLRRGEHTYTYVARATTPGTFVHPPVHGEMMYRPSVFGRTATGTLVVETPAEGMAVR